MKLSDTLQIISLGAITVALFLNYKQARHTGRQATETSKQVQLSASIVKQDSYRRLTDYGTTFNAVLLSGNQDLLAWFLASRQIPVSSHDMNLRHMFMFVRMDVHQAVYVSHTSGDLEENAWASWLKVIESDVATAEYRTVWRAVNDHYIVEFATFITALIHEQEATGENLEGTE